MKDEKKAKDIAGVCLNEYVVQCVQSHGTPDAKAFDGLTPAELKDAEIHEYDVNGEKWLVLDSATHKFVVNATAQNYYQIFNKTTGFNIRMGKDVNDDPAWCPLGPEILDLEISINGCPKVGGASCKFCCPPDTKITLADGSRKNIQDIVAGDEVLSLGIGKINQFKKNEVVETYERDYDGDLIVIELENGQTVKVTPNHPFVLRDGTEVKAEDITPDMDIVVENEYAHCQVCGKPKVRGDKFIERFVCSSKCQEKNHKVCPICGNPTKTIKHTFCGHCTNVPPELKGHPLLNTWGTMLQRCYNPARNKHEFYADKGIKVCPRWMDFGNFLADMGERPDGFTLDRIDNSKGYSPDNCRWSPQRDQKLNRGRFSTSARKYKGVYKHGSKYVANITVDGNGIYLGTFNSEEDAARAYDKALLQHGGDKEHCNFKD